MSTNQDLSKPHSMLTAECQGRLIEPLENYGETCYWHGEGSHGWHSKPLEQANVVEPVGFVVEAEKTPSTEAAIMLARCYIAGADTHQKSYDSAAADAASAIAQAEREAEPDNIYVGHVDYSKFYGLTLHDACVQACTNLGEPQLGYVVYLGLEYTWNDVLGWSYDTLGIAPPEPGPSALDVILEKVAS